MRVLVVTQYFWPEDFRINDLTAELTRRGHQVTVLTGVPNYPDGRIFPQYRAAPRQFDEYQGARLVRVPILPRGRGGLRLILNYFSFALSACVLGAWRLRGRDFDVIFTCQLSPVTIAIPAIFMRALKRAPMALWVLDLWPESLQAIGVVRSRSILKLVGALVSGIYRRCDLILAQSRSFIPQIESRCASAASRIEYFPSWAESIFDREGAAVAPELPAKDGKFDVMFAGNIGDAQDFPSILAAAERLKEDANIRWLIVGSGRAADWVAAEIARRGLSDTVIMLGRHPVERMPAFYGRADCLLVSLRDEPIFAMTIPAKLQSYLAAGVPIVGMLNGEGALAIEAAKAGIACKAGDDAALARAVVDMRNLPASDRVSMGERGRAYARSEFGRQLLMDKLENRLRSLANTHA